MKLLVLCLSLLFVFSCRNTNQNTNEISNNESLLPNAQGGTSDILIVVDKGIWKKGLEVLFSDIFKKEIKGLYNPEVNFDLITVSKNGFSDLFKKQKVIIEIDVNKRYASATINTKGNRYAKGQLYVKILGPNEAAVAEKIKELSPALLQKIENNRIYNLQKQLSLQTKELFAKEFQYKFDAKIAVPNSYHLVDNDTNLMYFGKKAKALCESGRNTECYYQMGFMIYKFPYQDSLSFSKEFLMNLRDSLTQVHIVGKEEDNRSYMEVEQDFPVSIKSIISNGYQGVELRGWWNMKNATMGGPFKSYLFLNEATNQLYFLDGFVFAPNFKKRDFLMEIEAIATSIEFTP